MGKKGERYEVVSPYDDYGLFILKNKQKSKMIIHRQAKTRFRLAAKKY